MFMWPINVVFPISGSKIKQKYIILIHRQHKLKSDIMSINDNQESIKDGICANRLVSNDSL